MFAEPQPAGPAQRVRAGLLSPARAVTLEVPGRRTARLISFPLAVADYEGDDLALGSRWISGGGVENWPKRRILLSRGGNIFARLCLGLPLTDATGGFRAYRRRALIDLDLASVRSQGYCFQIELAFRAVRARMSVIEIPIRFADRELGQSKMNGSIVIESVRRLISWGIHERGRQVRSRLFLGRRPAPVLPVPGTAGRSLRAVNAEAR